MRRFLSFMILTAAMAGCSKSGDSVIPPSQPSGYSRLISIYNSGERFVSFEKDGSSTKLTFTESTLRLSDDILEVHDCTHTGHPPICVNAGGTQWLISGAETGIGYHDGYPDEESQPVYVYVDETTLHIFVSNGNVLNFKKKSADGTEVFTMPVIRLSHQADRVHLNSYRDGRITINDPDLQYSDEETITLDMEIKGRGKSTWDMPKQPYHVKLAEKTEVLGMPANKDWALLADYSDKSLMRNFTAMKIAGILGFPWTPKVRHVEVYLNSEYMGVYELFEHKEVAKAKVNIGEDEYYFEIEENNSDSEPCFSTGSGVQILYQNPKTPSESQKEYAANYFRNFENALFGENFADPDEGYARYIDVDSFVDYFIAEELSKDIDGNIRKSAYLTLENSRKLRFYHLWDFDLAFGNCNYFPSDADGGNGPTGWWIRDFGTKSVKNTGWYRRLFQDPVFVKKVQKRWNEVYPLLAAVPEAIDREVAEMGSAPGRNFDKWQILGTWVWPNVKVTGSYQGEVQYLKDFYGERLEWMNESINAL